MWPAIIVEHFSAPILSFIMFFFGQKILSYQSSYAFLLGLTIAVKVFPKKYNSGTYYLASFSLQKWVLPLF